LLIPGGNTDVAVQETSSLIKRRSTTVLFEPAFRTGECIARLDILRRTRKGWDVLEVKAAMENTSGTSDYVKDLAYSCMVAEKAGLVIDRACLVLISRKYRKGMPVESLFVECDYTLEVRAAKDDVTASWNQVALSTAKRVKPKPQFKYECRNCEFFPDSCFDMTIGHPIWQLPRLGKEPAKIQDEDPLAGKYFEIVRSVKTGIPYVSASLKDDLSRISWPAYYLDFETMQTALPLYPDVPPYEQVVTQYSLHRCASLQDLANPKHFEHLADPARDCQRELAESLLKRLGTKGSVIVYYAPFERSRLQALAVRFPDLKPRIDAVIGRLLDLLDIVRANVYHPSFGGSYSIKKVLPALVPELSYANLDIRDGSAAIAQFAAMALGKYSAQEVAATRENLLRYCKRDTEAMVRLHERLLEMRRMAENRP
jgi:hypothetical protein